MTAWAYGIGLWGIVLVNVMILSVRFLARSQGFKVNWWSRSQSPEREHLKALARGADAALAIKARLFLRLEMAGWVLAVPFMILFFWGMAGR
jgi:hypothetical protein